MDNLTHSLIGAAFVRTLPKRLQRPELYWASILGSNAPDADFLVNFWPGANSLDYLVHHRGYTHTFLFAPLVGLLSAFGAKKATGTKSWSFALIAVAIAACFLHIGADFLNNYGVHPFTPFLNRWYYGDSVYIVEPLIWFSLLPFIATEAEKQWARTGWWMLSGAMIILVWLFPNFGTPLSGSLTLFFSTSALLIYRSRSAPLRAAIATTLFASVLGTFAFGGYRAREIAQDHWRNETKGEEIWSDSSSTPMPGNPLCWSLWVAAKSTTEFRYRLAKVSLWPSVFPVTECDPLPPTAHTADVTPSAFSSNLSIRWVHESNLSFQDFEDFKEKSPDFRRFLSFARFPFIKKLPNGATVVGDLRYDRQASLGFAEFEIAPR